MKNLNVTITDSKTKNFVARKLYNILTNINTDFDDKSQFLPAEDFVSNRLIGFDSEYRDEYFNIKKYRRGIIVSMSVKGSMCSVFFTKEEHKILIKRVKNKLMKLEQEWHYRKDRKILQLEKENEELKNKLVKSDKKYCAHTTKTNESTLEKMNDSTVRCKCCDQKFSKII